LTPLMLHKERETILASMKLSDEDAGQYARTVMSAAEIVMHYYYKKLTPSQLVDTAVRGMYRKLDEPISTELKEKLDGVKTMQKAELLGALTIARPYL